MTNRSVLDWPSGVSLYKPAKCHNGFTLVHGRGHWDPTHSTSPQGMPFWHLIDMRGRVIHRWHGDPVRRIGTQLFERVANGNYVSNGYHVTEQDWEGNVVWSLTADFRNPVSKTFHHDVQKTPAGNYLVVTQEPVDAPEISRVTLLDDHYVEVTPDREVVWEWWAHKHYDEFALSDEARHIIYETGGGQHWPLRAGDWLHANTIHALPPNLLYDKGDTRFKPGNILSCSRDLNMVFIIDTDSGQIVWKWGHLDRMPGSKMWLDGVGEERKALVGPHDPKMLDNGNILIYDNGGSGGYPPVVRFYTRLVEVDPIRGEVVWEYVYRPQAAKFLSIVTGGVQRLPNGNTLSLDTDKGRVFEITPQGEIVWEYINPRGGFYRTQRISYEDCPLADPFYAETDGHMGVRPAGTEIPKGIGLPVQGTPDYCPRFYG